MSRIQYIKKKIGPDRLAIIDMANKILDEYSAQGFNMTVRQVYYKFVARDLFPDDRTWRRLPNGRWKADSSGTKNAEPNYKWLGDILSDGRMCGLIDWGYIEDRTRNLEELPSWDTTGEMLNSAFNWHHRSRWENQPYRLEVWCEKEALIGIFASVCDKWDVPYFACRGYVSLSEAWRAAERLKGYVDNDQDPIILHFGDHDPSGVDMTRDIGARFEKFGVSLDVQRMALNMDQVDKFKPPPNPTKLGDARAKKYIAKFGYQSWELDALEPSMLIGLVEQMIEQVRDRDLWEEVIDREVEDRAHLRTLCKQWPKVDKKLDKKILAISRRIVDKSRKYEDERDM